MPCAGILDFAVQVRGPWASAGQGGAPNLTPQSQSETSMLLRPSVAGGLCSFKGGCGEAVLAGLGFFLCS